MATMLLELMLTRLFSVTAGYHFAFMIVSMTMFGMTLGAMVALAVVSNETSKACKSLRLNCLALAISIPASYFIQVYANEPLLKAGPFVWIAVTFIISSLPFYFSGVVISLCLTRFSEVGKLYCVDLIGAGLSCLLLVGGLTLLDGQAMIIISGVCAALAACAFSTFKSERASVVPSLIVTAATLMLFSVPSPTPMLNTNAPIEYVKWSPVGRVVASPVEGPAVTWAKVKQSPDVPPFLQKWLFIDFGAATVITSAAASKDQLEPMKLDVTALGNILRPQRSLFVIGVGGGRDILTGLLFGQKRIDGIEINPAIVGMLRDKYAEFVGHLAQKDGINIVNDEARNWLARTNKTYALIQCSLVDTWSASASGAFMLTENTLYTKEAFELYLKHLEKDGVLSFLRWGDQREYGQLLRLLSLAKGALNSSGVTNVGDHIMLIAAPYREGNHNIGNLFVSPTPFSDADCHKIADICKEREYTALWIPRLAKLEPFAKAIEDPNWLDPSMPTDDRPFFFCPTKSQSDESAIAEPAQGKGLALLVFTLALSGILVFSTILVPMWTKLKMKLGTSSQMRRSVLYFSSLGLGFIMFEVGMIQRLTLLVGNPTYGLSVVLFALLVASGVGSYASQRLIGRGIDAKPLLRTALISSLVATTASTLVCTFLLGTFDAFQLVERLVLAAALVAVPGFFMGFAFPVGMIIFTEKTPEAGAWFWAVNGATSVLGSVLAAIVSITLGTKYTTGFAGLLYLIALLVV